MLDSEESAEIPTVYGQLNKCPCISESNKYLNINRRNGALSLVVNWGTVAASLVFSRRNVAPSLAVSVRIVASLLVS